MSYFTPPKQHAKADGLRLAIVASSFNGDIVTGLLQGAERALKEAVSVECTLVECYSNWHEAWDQQMILDKVKESKGTLARYMVHRVPGALELPLAARWLAGQGLAEQWLGEQDHLGNVVPPDAIVALGVVLRGQTPHFDYVSSSCMQGLLEVSLHTGVPVTCGVLTVNDEAQAKDRSAENENNRGYSAMHAAIAMAALRKLIH
ncbi:MAG: 6,7-dimethyl-8-ribityllumazine synthase [Candidatus Porifericomitaceae bacterium WSBS_2022_MAG_OTU9]